MLSSQTRLGQTDGRCVSAERARIITLLNAIWERREAFYGHLWHQQHLDHVRHIVLDDVRQLALAGALPLPHRQGWVVYLIADSHHCPEMACSLDHQVRPYQLHAVEASVELAGARLLLCPAWQREIGGGQ